MPGYNTVQENLQSVHENVYYAKTGVLKMQHNSYRNL